MIIYNDFREFENEAHEVDKRMFYVNAWIYRIPKREPARNQKSKVFIPNTRDKKEFIALLAHELGHSAIDPITLVDYAKYASVVRRVLASDKHRYMDYANVISDIIVSYYLSKDGMIKDAWRHYITQLWNSGYSTDDKLKWILYAYYDKIFDGNIGLYEVYRDEVDEIIKVLDEEVDKMMIYVKITRILEKAPEKQIRDQEEGQGEGREGNQEGERRQRGRGILADQGGNDSPPIMEDDADPERLIEAVAKFASDIEELKAMARVLLKGIGDDEARKRLMQIASKELLYRFYQAEADKVRISISYPKRISYNSVKLGSRKWRLEDGYRSIDVKRTILKYGVAIPGITLRSPYMFRMNVPNSKGAKPVDIVISIDTSGSVDYPNGLMAVCADYIVVMVYALIDEAKRLNQNVGLTLWSHKIKYTTLPKCLNYREVEKIKKDILDVGLWGGSTHIRLALEQARQYSDKLFIVLTDGEVYLEDLIGVSNVVFFLIQPSPGAKELFLSRYGVERVFIIDDLANIPRVVLKWFRSQSP